MQVSKKALYVRNKILELCKEHCFELTPEQVDTVLSLGDEYKGDVSCTGYKDGGKAQNSLTVELDESELVKPLVDEPLLQIELKDINSVPTVFYKGEEINKKIRVTFDYVTDSDERLSPTYIHLEHADIESGKMNTFVIQHNQPIEGVTLYADGEPIAVVYK